MSSGAIDEYKDDFEDYEDDVDDAVEFQSGAPRLVSTLAKCMSGPVSESFTAIQKSDLLSRTGKAEVAIAREVAVDDRRAKQTESKSLADVKQPKYLTANPRNLIGWFDPAVHRARGLQGHLALVSERFIAFDQLPQTEYQLYRPRLCSAKKRMKE